MDGGSVVINSSFQSADEEAWDLELWWELFACSNVRLLTRLKENRSFVLGPVKLERKTMQVQLVEKFRLLLDVVSFSSLFVGFRSD